MSLVGTLGKVAMGMVAAKAMRGVMGGGSRGNTGGGLLGSLMGGGQQQQGGGLAGMLGQLTGGGAQGRGMQQGGGLGSILGQLTGGGAQGRGGLGQLGSMLGGAGGAAGGGLGGLLSQLGGGAQGGGGLGDLLNGTLQGNDIAPTSDDEAQAEIMLRAMINAAKADGEIDAEEQAAIAEHIGDDITPEELALVKEIMAEPLDVDAFANSIPAELAQQAYMMSLLAIDVDSQAEAQYLAKLGDQIGVSHEMANQIHEQVGEPKLYS